ncbi:hypothetical protein FH972_005082 [Carpinus fangiana]|uniref:Protein DETOXIFICATION n=1 Tax=Carpinus fangiana TaxID=176857 RepID=A0A5N6QN69_9ROSI|nr:hypothetical protein FH972_005082 [Carpinus fangiana]
MQLKALIARPSHPHLFQNPTQRPLSLFPRFRAPLFPSNLSLSSKTLKVRRNRITTACVSPTEDLIDNDPEISGENDGGVVSVSEKLLGVVEGGESGSEEGQSIWNQMLEIVKFSGPATGLWICGPLMSLIDTVVIGQGSSIELAALAFTGPKNAHVVPAANTYVQVHFLFKSSVCFDIYFEYFQLFLFESVACNFLGVFLHLGKLLQMLLHILVSYMMIENLNKKGYNAFALSVPSPRELLTVIGLAAPVFVMMMSKVAFFSLITYFATSVGTHTMAAHQVSYTSNFLLSELQQARMLLKSLVIIGAILGLLLGIVATCVPWLFPKIFTHDQNVIQEMHKVLIPFFLALAITPPTLSLEGTLLAGRDLKFISLSMSGCFSMGALLLLLVNSRGYGLPGCWFGLVAFQWARFFISVRRLLSPNGILYSDDLSQYNLKKACISHGKMQLKALVARPSHAPLFQNPTQRPISLFPRFHPTLFTSNLSLISRPKSRRNRIITACISPSEELIDNGPEISGENDGGMASVTEKVLGVVEGEESGSEEKQSIWNQMKEIVKFTGPATGLWICGPLMSLIDTAVIGQGSSIELAALGPATVICDYMSYSFMFLSIATSNMVATSLARKDKNEVHHHISNLLFIGLTCGCLMLLFTKFFGSWALTAFTGPKNAHVVPAANTYVQVHFLFKSSVCFDICFKYFQSFLWYRFISRYMMIETLNKKGYNAFAISVPSPHELLTVLGLATPVFLTMMSKVAFYSLLIYFSTSTGTHTMAAHQVMVQTFCMCTVWGEPLSQTAQSFMPELIYGVGRNLEKVSNGHFSDAAAF